MTTLINTKLGQNRGNPRVWIQGKKLDREGFTVGVRYDISVDHRGVKLEKSELGKYIVSRKKRGEIYDPVIDITRRELSELFAGVCLLRISIRNGKIRITAHHEHCDQVEREERLLRRLHSNEPLKVCSLFHGGGVLDKAIHAGLSHHFVKSTVAIAVEAEPTYLESSLRNNPELWDDASVIVESKIEKVLPQKNGLDCDIVVAGIPCTGASRSGRSKNQLAHAEDHPGAGAMFFSVLSFVQALNPSVILIENVVEYAATASMSVIRSVLASLGYLMFETVLDGNAFGALERRKRLCVVAVSSGLSEFSFECLEPEFEKPGSLARVLSPIEEIDPNDWKTFSYLDEKATRDKATGKGFKRQLLTGDSTYCGTIGRGYSKARSTEPFILHPTKTGFMRLLTPAEHARVKGIPEGVIEGLSSTRGHEVLGQSVIYPAFKAVGSHIAKWLRKNQLVRPLI